MLRRESAELSIFLHLRVTISDALVGVTDPRILRKGDRVAVLGRGTAVVEHVNSEWIQAVVLSKCPLRIARKCIRWDGQNMRWETSPHACVETKAKA